MNIFFQVEANPVQMRCQCFHSAVMAYFVILVGLVSKIGHLHCAWYVAVSTCYSRESARNFADKLIQAKL